MQISFKPAEAKKPVALVGQTGVQYGLQAPSSSTSAPKKPGSLFTIDDDDELNVNKRLQIEEAAKAQDKKTQKLMEDALAADPTAFEYDGVYRDMKKEEIARKMADKETGPKKPKYMNNLLQNAEQKKKQDMLVLQKTLQRELETEKELFGENQEKFVTATYKKQLEMNKIYEDEQKKKEERDKAHTIEGRGSTNEFLKNLLESKSSGMEIKPLEGEAKKEERGRKRSRSRSSSPEDVRRSGSRERDRVERLRERATRDAAEAERLRAEREQKRAEKTAELQAEYAKKQTTEDEVTSAKERYLARKKARLEGGETPSFPPS